MTTISDVGSAPVHESTLTASADVERKLPEHGLAICLSGGGYRAMLFHLGALWRMAEAGLLAKVERISSVSGGSITAGALGLHWADVVSGDAKATAAAFERNVVPPIMKMAQTTIDAWSIGKGLLLPGSISDKVQKYYDEILFHGATLQSLPDTPRFVINATNITTGSLWRFSKPYMADYQVGLVNRPTVKLSLAVAASSAFPPPLSPTTLKVDPDHYEPNDRYATFTDPKYRSEIKLSDGGVYDNIGLETAWKNYTELLVCDAGAAFKSDPKPDVNWLSSTRRTLDLVDNQVRALRRHQINNSLSLGYGPGGLNANPEFARIGEYWSIGWPVSRTQNALAPSDAERIKELAETPTRLKALDATYAHRLINWGYLSTDTALRRRYLPELPAVAALPMPSGI